MHAYPLEYTSIYLYYSLAMQRNTFILLLESETPYNVTVKALNPAGCGEEQQIYCFTQEGHNKLVLLHGVHMYFCSYFSFYSASSATECCSCEV